MNIDGTENRDTSCTPSNTLEAIKQNQEIIVLTISGPNTYYDYHGKGMGVEYQLAEKFAEKLNVHVRVDVCKDTAEMTSRLRKGEGDVIAVPLSEKYLRGFIAVADSWAVGENSQELAAAIRSWYTPKLLSQAKRQEQYLLSVSSITRHVYPFMLSPQKGRISNYDYLFQRYAPVAGMDWTLMAAQCYTESCFDPKAHSFAGACGLMQLMPCTADYLGVPREKMYDPETNVGGAARMMRDLLSRYRDVSSPIDRISFALAAYNAGNGHIQDAMALTRKYGGSPRRWRDVQKYVLLLQLPHYYNDPVVKYGYMRGNETSSYVDLIIQRWQKYSASVGGRPVSGIEMLSSSSSSDVSPINGSPHRAVHKNKWRKE